MVTFSLTTTTSWERGGDLTTYQLCVIGFKFYDTLVMIQSIGVVARWSVLVFWYSLSDLFSLARVLTCSVFSVRYSSTSSSTSRKILPFCPPSSCSSLCFAWIICNHSYLLVWLLSLIIKLIVVFLYPKFCVFVFSLVHSVALWRGSNSDVLKHLSSSRRSNFHVCVHVPFPCAFDRLVMREQFGRAEAPLLLKAFGLSCSCSCSLPLWQGSNSGVLKHLSSSRPSDFRVCVLVSFLAFGRLVTRERFGRAHAPLLRLSFVCSCLLPCVFGRLVTRERFGRAHAPLILIKVYVHSWMCVLMFFVCLPCVPLRSLVRWAENSMRADPRRVSKHDQPQSSTSSKPPRAHTLNKSQSTKAFGCTKGQRALARQVVFFDRQNMGLLHPFLLPSPRPHVVPPE